MSVEAYNLNPLFSSNCEMTHPIEPNGLVYNTQFRYGSNGTVPSPTEMFNPTVECQTSLLNPFYNTSPVDCFFHQSMKPAIHSVDSSVTFNSQNNAKNFDFRPLVLSSSMRKRPREESFVVNPKNCTDPLMFLGQDLSFNVQQHNFDLDRLISCHTERMKMEMEELRKAQWRKITEIEEKGKTQWRKIMEGFEQGLTQKLRAKDEIIDHIGKQNHILEEKIKSLSVENQIWRDMSQSSEATANTLRSNIQQVLTSVEHLRFKESKIDDDDAQSCCGSNYEGDRWRLVEEAQDKKRMRRMTWPMCLNCGKGEASVLLLPCRHLCLCITCGSLVNTCPICKSPKNAALPVNLSS